MRVLVTGASGFVASHVRKHLEMHGNEVIGTDITGVENKGSVTDSDFVLNRLGKLDFDAIIHLAAIADLAKTQEDPYFCYEVNCFGTLNILELATRKKVRRLIYASSANVFGAPTKVPVLEHTMFRPRVPYDYSKVIGENLTVSYFRTKGLPIAITRSWLLFGENDIPGRAVPRFINACLRNEPIKLFNSGRDTTAPSHAANYAELVRLILENDASIGEAFNFSGERVVSVKEIAVIIKKLTNSSSDLLMLAPRSEFERIPQVSYPSLQKSRKLLRYRPITNLEQGLRRTIDWVKNAPLAR